MADLAGFRDAVRATRRSVGRTQQQLARAIGLHPDVLSHKLRGDVGKDLTTPEVCSIVTVLAEWGALQSRGHAETLMRFMGLSSALIAAQPWDRPPLARLDAESTPTTSAPGRERLALSPVPPPAPLTPLVGRASEIAQVCDALRAHRLVTLTGTGGTGKTRVALSVAGAVVDRYPDGVAFTDLTAVAEAALLPVALLRAVGIGARSAEEAESHLHAMVRDARMLFVLDNMEHLVEAATAVSRLLAAAPSVSLLVTSRVVLRIYGEQQIRVPALQLPRRAGDRADHRADDRAPAEELKASEAVQLFLLRARSARPGFDPDGAELAAVGDICAALDGIPLALELAAARMRRWTPQAVLQRLDAPLSFLTNGALDLPRRQQTLLATLEWSDGLLAEADRDLFLRLGVFVGPFDAEAAAAVADVGLEVVDDRLEQLVDQSLLEVAEDAWPRLRMLEPVRQYALARLAERGNLEATRCAHLRYYSGVAEAVRSQWTGADQGAALARLRPHLDNINAALSWVESLADDRYRQEGLALAAAAAPMWRRCAAVAEGSLHLERLLIGAAPGYQERQDYEQHVERKRAEAALRADALIEASSLSCFAGEASRAQGFAREALELSIELDDSCQQSRAYRYLGEAVLQQGDLDTGEELFQAQLSSARASGVAWAEADADNMLGQLNHRRHRDDLARQQLQRALTTAQAAGAVGIAAAALDSLANLDFDKGHLASAARQHAVALRMHQQNGDLRGTAYDLEGLSRVAAAQRADLDALHCYAAAQALRQPHGWRLSDVEQLRLRQVIELAATASGDPASAAALAQGRSWPLADIVALALEHYGSS